ncbi:MAG: hypothetical protein ACREMY_03310, partial [bacterium]
MRQPYAAYVAHIRSCRHPLCIDRRLNHWEFAEQLSGRNQRIPTRYETSGRTDKVLRASGAGNGCVSAYTTSVK